MIEMIQRRAATLTVKCMLKFFKTIVTICIQQFDMAALRWRCFKVASPFVETYL